MAKGPTKKMYKSSTFIMLVMIFLFFGTGIGKLGFLTFVKGEEYSKAAANQQLRDVVLTPERGKIFDKNMTVLAASATVWMVYISPQNIKKDTPEEGQKIAKKLSEILDVDYEKILAQTKKNTAYEIIKRGVEQPEADKVREMMAEDKNLASIIGLDQSFKRYYPNDNLLSTVLGFVGTDNQGLGGVEIQYEKVLKGTPGRVVAAKNARGSEMPFTFETTIEAKPGNSLVLTIDKYIQHIAEKFLEQAIIDNKVSERGSVIAMDVNTGGILAMSTKPDYNPNKPFEIYDEAARKAIEALEGDERKKAVSVAQLTQWKDKNVSDPYEPGSVFKIITGAAALEEGVINNNSSFYCPGFIKIANRTIRCHNHSGHGTQNLMQAFQNSCNPAFIEIGQKLGITTFYKYFRAFGLHEKTGIDLPGEATSNYHSKPGIVELASTSFGQTFKITPVQLVTAISAAVNGGYLVQPHVVSSEVDENNNIVKNYENNNAKRQVLSESTVENMRSLLEKVVDGGSGRNAYVAGYRIAGKTGTSQKIAEAVSGKKETYIGSFCGIAPANNPQIAILITLDTPNVPVYYGGTIAAPAVGKMMEQILPYMGVEPVYTEDELKKLDVKTPNLVGDTVEKATSKLKDANLKIKVVGNGESVNRQLPSYNQSIPKGGTVVVYTDVDSSAKMVTVPDLTSKTVSAVNQAASSAYINVKYSGTSLTAAGAMSYSQSIPAGTSVEEGTVVTVEFRVRDNVQ